MSFHTGVFADFVLIGWDKQRAVLISLFQTCRQNCKQPAPAYRLQSRPQVTAFTLLEVILTLAMSVALMLLIGGAMQFYGRTMNVHDMDVRQIQLASSLLQMIEDDLRATLYTRPVDTAGLEAMLAANAGEQQRSDEDLSAAGIESDVSSDIPNDQQTDATILKTPGLIGNQYQIQVDLSRLPRLEEYAVMMNGTTADLEDIPSNVKTVSYYVQSAGASGGVRDSIDRLDANVAGMSAGGLVRRSLDRAATVEAGLTGGLSRLSQTGDLIAPEVIGLEFLYWDGISWLTEWSSDDYEELPLAVQVKLTMDDPIAAAASTNQGIVGSQASTRVFQHVIRLPLARPIDTSEEEELSEAGL